MIKLGDDGTMDTVLYCSECGQEFRYNYEPSPDWTDEECILGADSAYDTFVDWAIEDATNDHECPGDEPTEPGEDDITTTDHNNFFQYGHPMLRALGTDANISRHWDYREHGRGVWRQLGMFDNCEAALRAYMDRVQFWPNVWSISDHGNAHLMDLSEGK